MPLLDFPCCIPPLREFPSKLTAIFSMQFPTGCDWGAWVELVLDEQKKTWKGAKGDAGNRISAQVVLSCQGGDLVASMRGDVDRGADCQGSSQRDAVVPCYAEGLEQLDMGQVDLQHGCCQQQPGEGSYGIYLLSTAQLPVSPMPPLALPCTLIKPDECCETPDPKSGDGGVVGRPVAAKAPGAVRGGSPARPNCPESCCSVNSPTAGLGGGHGARPPVFSAAPVRYANGEVAVVSNDLEAGGFGLPWGHTRSFASRLTKFDSDQLGQGWNWLVQEWPYLIADLARLPDGSSGRRGATE